ncbi:hypothetical protein EVAR_68960_1 [Eumeta japonica]|uniref:Uncharacterized protein n=1 Tax=Eumeta variegata TaxID=151549 RepID=A0A4C2A331_EUMVA|nr:hypothetical protein EVAR_68960_1 [Eumeta japonica]
MCATSKVRSHAVKAAPAPSLAPLRRLLADAPTRVCTKAACKQIARCAGRRAPRPLHVGLSLYVSPARRPACAIRYAPVRYLNECRRRCVVFCGYS